MKVNEDVAGTSSHLPVLRWACKAVPEGPILEYGGGLYSTPFFLGLGREVVTIEEVPAWREYLEAQDSHQIEHEMTDEIFQRHDWAVVFIDHGRAPWEWIDQRADALENVRGKCAIALVHDWHVGIGHRDDVVARFMYHGWFAPNAGTMHTAMCSDSIDVRTAKIRGGRVYTGFFDAPEEFPN